MFGVNPEIENLKTTTFGITDHEKQHGKSNRAERVMWQQHGMSNRAEKVMLQQGKSNHAENVGQLTKIASENGNVLCALTFLSMMALIAQRITPARCSDMFRQVERAYIQYSASMVWLQHPIPSLFHETVLKIGLPFTLI